MVAFVRFVNFVRAPEAVRGHPGVSWLGAGGNRIDLRAATQRRGRSARTPVHHTSCEKRPGSAPFRPPRRHTDAAARRETRPLSGRPNKLPDGRFAPMPPARSHTLDARRWFEPPVIPLVPLQTQAPCPPLIRMCPRYAPANEPSLTLGDRGVGNRTKRPCGL